MGEIKFNLRDKKSKGKTLINLIFNYNNLRLKTSTGISIKPIHWNSNTQRAKQLTSFIEHIHINEELEKQKSTLLSIYNKHLKNGEILSVSDLKSEFQSNLGTNIPLEKPKGFWEHYNDFVEYKKKRIKDVRDYDKSLRKHLLNTEKKLNTPLSFNLLKQGQGKFIEHWEEYLHYEADNGKGAGLSLNFIGKLNKCLKSFLNWSFDNDISNTFNLKHFPTHMEEVDTIYLTKVELEKIENLTLFDEDDIIRDLFLIGCETGMRFSDYSNLDKILIDETRIKFFDQKTKNYSIIPISDRLQRIIKKYKSKLPIYNGKVTTFNKILSSICNQAKIDKEVISQKTQNKEKITLKNFKYELVTSHTARRTFCTLKYLDGMPSYAIMKFSGHKKESSFLRYLRLDNETTANSFENFFV